MKYPITLTNVMRGVKKHKLADKLGDGVYKFLIELILEANELEFKNPIDLTVKQALAIGGGENRQTLYNRRKSLKKIMLDGKHLVKVTVGSYGQRSLATYEIDYKLLMAQNGAWQGIEQPTSNEFDEPLTRALRPLDVTLDDPLPILRSDQKRSEENNNNKPPAPLPEKEKPKRVGLRERIIEGAERIAEEERHDRITDALKKAIGGDANAITLVSNQYQLDAFNAVMEYPDEKVLHVIQVSGEKGKLHQDNAITYIKKGLENFAEWYGGVSGGNGGGQSMGERDRAKAAAILKLMKEELAELEAKTDGDWSEHIMAMQVAIAEAEVG